ncbi:MAG: hypothetical protein JO214_03560 [Frankiaceae bacterium]|nr:hypothetical protein [Frankiaceae bacterium]
MSQDLSPYIGGSAPLLRDSRRAARQISRYQANSQMRIASTDTETDVSIAKVESATAVTGSAMMSVTRVEVAIKSLEMQAPGVSGRLAMLADMHALNVADFMADHQRKLRRQ